MRGLEVDTFTILETIRTKSATKPTVGKCYILQTRCRSLSTYEMIFFAFQSKVPFFPVASADIQTSDFRCPFWVARLPVPPFMNFVPHVLPFVLLKGC